MSTVSTTDHRHEIRVPAGTSSSQLQAIIDGARSPCVIRLDAGFYRFDRTIVIDRSGISLLGAGVDRTVIVPDLVEAEGPAIRVAAKPLGQSWRPTRGIEEGGRALHLPLGHGLRAGDVVWLERPNHAEDLAALPDGDWPGERPVHTSMACVEKVQGTVAVLETGVHACFPVMETTVRQMPAVSNAEVGRFTVLYAFERAAAPLAGDDIPAVELDGCFDSSVHHILVRGAGAAGFRFRRSLKISGDSLAVIGHQGRPSSAGTCAVRLEDTYESKLINLEDQNVGASVSFATWGVELNNYVHVRGKNDAAGLPEEWTPLPAASDPLKGVEWLFVEGGELFTIRDLMGIDRGLPRPSNENCRPFL